MNETYEADKARALDRIRKMLALANDATASEGERDNAMRMAHKTLAKWNLSLAEAKSSPDDRGKNILAMRSPPWARTCANAVATLFFCEYFFIQRRGEQRIHHYFIGREANAVTAMEISAFVIRSIQNESGRKRKEIGADGAWQTAFIKGAAHKVYYRCQELRKQAEMESAMANVPKSSGTALVLASVYQQELAANAEWLERNGWRVKVAKTRQQDVKNYDAYVRGTEYGAGISLNRQIGNGKSSNGGKKQIESK
jgi:hypothetical protein